MASLESVHVLLVDDNQHMRAITSAILQSAGIRKVREAHDGAAALEALRDHPVDWFWVHKRWPDAVYAALESSRF